jgi:hypothetical protein
MARLAALVPKPRAHLTRYHGVFAPASPDRARVVPKTRAASSEPSAVDRQRAMTWAQRLKRVFAIDIEVCRRSSQSEPGAARARSSDLSASPSSSPPAPPCGTGGYWLEPGCAGISGGKGKIQAPEREGVGPAQPCWPPRSAVIGPASACPSGFGADIMASYASQPPT